MTMYWIIAEAAPAPEGTIVSSETAAPAADVTATGTQTPGGTAEAVKTDVKTKEPANPLLQFAPLLLVFVLMYFMLFRAPKKRQQEHQKMVAGLKRNDRVRTIGGVLATVLDVRDEEIVIKIDESNNTKMRVIPSAIAAVLSEEKKNQ
ncbi:MAG: preprotein translocase subunit YajC [Phycisphaerae bacterium]|nr:preprotein translocase subunit YajC [Phycisphaerae bacterium]